MRAPLCDHGRPRALPHRLDALHPQPQLFSRPIAPDTALRTAQLVACGAEGLPIALGRRAKKGHLRQTDKQSRLPEPKHTPRRGLSEQAGQGVGLTLSCPAGLHGAPGTLHLCLSPASSQMSRPLHRHSSLFWLDKGNPSLLPGGKIHSFSQKQDTGLVPKRPGSGSCFCCLTLLPVSDLATAVHLLRQLLTALPHWP